MRRALRGDYDRLMQIVDHLVAVSSPIGGAQVETTFTRESTAASARREGAGVFLGNGIRRVTYPQGQHAQARPNRSDNAIPNR
jgi:hypothetical protein